LNNSQAQSAAEVWLAKVCPETANYEKFFFLKIFLKSFELGQKLGF